MRIASGLTKGEIGRMRALGQLSAIRKRRLLRAWLNAPTIPGATIHLVPAEIERVRQILFKDFGLNIDAEQGNGRPLTPRALDRCLWAGVLHIRGVLDHEVARRRVVLALSDDAKFWSRIGEAEEVLWE